MVRSRDADSDGSSFSALWRISRALKDEERRQAVASLSASAASGVEKDSLVVVRSIAEARPYAKEGPHAEFLPLVGKAIPLALTRDVRAAYRRLTREAPHARAIIDIICETPPARGRRSGGRRSWLEIRAAEKFSLR